MWIDVATSRFLNFLSVRRENSVQILSIQVFSTKFQKFVAIFSVEVVLVLLHITKFRNI